MDTPSIGDRLGWRGNRYRKRIEGLGTSMRIRLTRRLKSLRAKALVPHGRETVSCSLRSGDRELQAENFACVKSPKLLGSPHIKYSTLSLSAICRKLMGRTEQAMPVR